MEGQMKKTTILTAFLLFVFLSFNSSCKSNEDEAFSILGNWTIGMVYSGTYVYTGGTITFAGSLTSGSVSVTFPPDTQIGTGTFTVTGSTVHFTVYWPDSEYTDTCTGTVVNDNSMNGTLVEQPGNINGTWNCTR
jgi:hypothetical protein